MTDIYIQNTVTCGHDDKKHYARGMCTYCYKKYWANQPDRKELIKKNRKERYWSDPEKHREESNKWCREHSEYVKERSSKYYESHKEQHYENTKKWKLRNPEKAQAISKNRTQKRRARIRSNPGVAPKSKEICHLLKDGICFYCHDDVGTKITIDHVIPISKGGSIGLENMLPACIKCNKNKAAKPVEKWLSSKKDTKFDDAKRHFGLL